MRTRMIAALTLTGSICLSGCSALPDEQVDAPSASSFSTVSAPATAVGFGQGALWSKPGFVTDANSFTVVEGNAVGVRQDSRGNRILQGVDVSNGEKAWSSTPDVFGTESAPIVVQDMTYRGRPYVATRQKVGDQTIIRIFDGYATSSSTKPTAQVTVKGKEATVTITPYGVLVTDADGNPSQYEVDAPTGKLIAYGGGPALDGDAGKPVAIGSGGAFVINHGGKGFTVAAPASAHSWDSKTTKQRPRGADSHAGTLLGTDGEYLIAKWSTPSGMVIAAQSATTGNVLAQGALGQDQSPQLNTQPVTSMGGRYIVWGSWLFDTQAGTAKKVPALDGFTPRMIVRDIAYGLGEDGAAKTADLSKATVAVKPAVAAPVGFADDGVGVFVAKGTLFAPPLS